MVDAYPKYIEMVELNYLDIPLAGSIPVLTTNDPIVVEVAPKTISGLMMV